MSNELVVVVFERGCEMTSLWVRELAQTCVASFMSLKTLGVEVWEVVWIEIDGIHLWIFEFFEFWGKIGLC